MTTTDLIQASRDRERRILEMWNGGSETKDIVTALNLTSRNVVIGVVTRARARGEDVLDKHEKLKIARSRTEQAIRGAGMSTAKNGIGGFVAPRFPASTGCQYPHGEPRTAEFHFCGKKRAPHRFPYCSEHLARCIDARSRSCQ